MMLPRFLEGFRNQWPSSYPPLMAHRSHIISTACDVALRSWDGRRKRWKASEEAIIAAARQRVGGTEDDMASAEWWVLWAIGVVEELKHGEYQLRGVIERHRLAGVK